MAILRVFPDKDTTAANYDYPSMGTKDISDYNIGASEILNLFQTEDMSGTASIFISFPMSEFPVDLTAAFYLHLADAQHGKTLPYGYTVHIQPVAQNWDEGRGLDADYYTDLGYANYHSATQTTAWQNPTTLSSTVTFSFPTGYEDLNANISSLISTAEFGYNIHIVDLGTYYIKMFHSRQTHFPTKKPYLEARWEDWTGSYSTYDMVKVLSGAYSGSFYPASTFTSAALSELSGSGSALIVQFSVPTVDPTGVLVSSLYNLKSVYDASEVVQLNLTTQRKDRGAVAIPTASSETSSVVLTNIYYRVVADVTDEVVVPFGTGSLKYTKLSYNDSGNFFNFRMANLPTGTLMRFDFIYDISGSWTMIPGDAFKFRVTEVTNG